VHNYSNKVEKSCSLSLCGDLPEDLTVNTGRDDYFLDPSYQLTRRIFGHSQEGEIRRCPQCGTYFRWIDLPQMCGSGNNDEERFIRLPQKATPLLEIIFSPNAKDHPDLGNVDEYFKSIKLDILLVLLSKLVHSAPKIFALFVPNLWRILLKNDTYSIQSLLSDYVSDEPERAEEVLEALRSIQVARHHSPLIDALLYCFTVVQKKK
jgi:hypothetical protein